MKNLTRDSVIDSMKGQEGKGKPRNSTHTRTPNFLSSETVKSRDNFGKTSREECIDQGPLLKTMSICEGLVKRTKKNLW